MTSTVLTVMPSALTSAARDEKGCRGIVCLVTSDARDLGSSADDYAHLARRRLDGRMAESV